MSAEASPNAPFRRHLGGLFAAWRGRLEGLSGHACLLCGAWTGATFCPDCQARDAAPRWRCGRCAIGLPDGLADHLQGRVDEGRPATASCADCRGEPPPFDAAWAALDYGPPWDRLIAAFKFHASPELARPLARLMHAAVPADAERPTLLMPVPLTAERWRERGYNQAWELARRLGPPLGLPVRDDLIERLVGGAHQASLSGPARRRQVRGAYAVPPAAVGVLAGAHVGLVDDVMTTGATLAECARVLRRAGARRITVWVLARTPAG
jgi:ComF family protein